MSLYAGTSFSHGGYTTPNLIRRMVELEWAVPRKVRTTIAGSTVYGRDRILHVFRIDLTNVEKKQSSYSEPGRQNRARLDS